MQPYNQAIRSRFDNPRHAGIIANNCDNGNRIGNGQAGIPGRTNVVRWQLLVDADGRIVDLKYQVYGCGVTVAACEWCAEELQGKSIADATELAVAAIIDALTIETMKHHCAALVKEAIDHAVADL